MIRSLRLLILLAAGLALLPSSLFAQPDLSGMWTLTWETPRGEQSFDIQIEQTEMSFTGTAEGPMGSVPIEEGSIDGDEVSFVMTLTMGGRGGGGQGRTVEQVLEGTLVDGKIEGEIQAPAMQGRGGGRGGAGGGGAGRASRGPRTFTMVRAGG